MMTGLLEPPQSPSLPPPYLDCQGPGRWKNATCLTATVISLMIAIVAMALPRTFDASESYHQD